VSWASPPTQIDIHSRAGAGKKVPFSVPTRVGKDKEENAECLANRSGAPALSQSTTRASGSNGVVR
jgi:hypothetical protein